MIRHILLVQFRSEATRAQLAAVQAAFMAIPEKIAGVASVEWGLNDSLEGLNAGYTHCILMTFANEPARQRYIPHPEHEALKSIFVPLIANIVVFDFTVQTQFVFPTKP